MFKLIFPANIHSQITRCTTFKVPSENLSSSIGNTLGNVALWKWSHDLPLPNWVPNLFGHKIWPEGVIAFASPLVCEHLTYFHGTTVYIYSTVAFSGTICKQRQTLCAISWENLFMPYANNKGATPPAHLSNLMSVYVVCCLDTIIPMLAI